MTQDNQQPITVAALIATRQGADATEFLSVLAHNKDKYGFPGGKLEADETPEQAVIGETEEEIGVIPTDITYIDVFDSLTPEGREIKMYVFSGTITRDIAPSREISELHWLTYDQMISRTELLTPMTIEYILPLLKS